MLPLKVKVLTASALFAFGANAAITGEDIYGLCKSKDTTDIAVCGMSILSFVQGFNTAEHHHDQRARVMCLPKNITPAEVIGKIVRHLEDIGSQKRKTSVDVIYTMALQKNFPCPKS